jgi:hypothetical protein
MNKRTKLIGGIAIATGALGAASAFLTKRNVRTKQTTKKISDVWARPGMQVTFRAELMPGRDNDDRTFRVRELLPSGRVLLHGVDGEHAEKEFERVQ